MLDTFKINKIVENLRKINREILLIEWDNVYSIKSIKKAETIPLLGYFCSGDVNIFNPWTSLERFSLDFLM